MMSTKMICGRWSAILASASKPSVAVTTSAPSRLSSVSAVRRMVFESSITITRRPSRLPARLSSCVITKLPRVRDASSLPASLQAVLYPSPLQDCQAFVINSLKVAEKPIRARRTAPANICQNLPQVVRMPCNVVVVMDPIETIKIAKDSTFAMLLEAQRRGHRLLYVVPGGLTLRGGQAFADLAPMTVRDDKA